MEREPIRESNGKADKMPLLDRIYFREFYTSLVRGVGYPGIPVAEGRKLVEGLAKTHDKEKIVKAADEMFDIDAKEVKLKASVRKLCFMLLGPAPDQRDAFYRNADGTPHARARREDAGDEETTQEQIKMKGNEGSGEGVAPQKCHGRRAGCRAIARVYTSGTYPPIYLLPYLPMKDCSNSAILVIAKSDQDKTVAHFLAFTDDDGEAIKMAKEHIWPSHVGLPDQGPGRNFNQFTIKRVWDCEPLPDKKLFIL